MVAAGDVAVDQFAGRAVGGIETTTAAGLIAIDSDASIGVRMCVELEKRTYFQGEEVICSQFMTIHRTIHLGYFNPVEMFFSSVATYKCRDSIP